MWSIIAREVNFGMAVDLMISAEQRYSYRNRRQRKYVPLGYLLEHTWRVACCSTALVVWLGALPGRCLKSALNSIQSEGFESAGSNCLMCTSPGTSCTRHSSGMRCGLGNIQNRSKQLLYLYLPNTNAHLIQALSKTWHAEIWTTRTVVGVLIHLPAYSSRIMRFWTEAV